MWAVPAVLLGYVAYFAYQTRDYFIDDAYIGFQYVRNLLSGQGFVFEPGGPAVEAVTNIGWLLFLAPFAALAEPTVAAKAVGFALLVTSLVLALRLGRDLAARYEPKEGLSSLAIVPVILLASSFDFLYFSLAGMETALLAVILLLMAWIAMRRPGSLWLPVLGAFAFLVHPEAVIAYPLYTLLLRSPEVNWRRLWLGNLVLAVLVGTVTAIRYAYFQDIVPNTFHCKPSGWFQIVVNGYNFLIGRNANVPFPLTGWLALPILVLGYIRLRRAAPAAAGILGAIAATGLAFCIYSKPDWTDMGRYFVPYLPAALVLFWVGLIRVIQRLVGRTPQMAAPAIAGVVAVLLVLIGMIDRTAKMARMEIFPGYILAGKNLVGPSLWIRDHLSEDATIATRRIGALAYYCERSIFDYAFGLPHPEVARLVAAAGGRFNSPSDPALGTLWQARAPDYLLEDGDMMDFIISRTGGTRERFSIHGLRYGVIKCFSIGREKEWVLARRLDAEL